MSPANERPANLAPHCGSCAFFDCEDGDCRCLHPHKVDRDHIEEAIADLAEDDGMTAWAIAESLMEAAFVDQEAQPYDNVCIYWRAIPPAIPGGGGDREARFLRAAARQDFVDLVSSIIKKNKVKP